MESLLTLRVIKGYTRPIISLGKEVSCLIDTGADTPVWTRGSERLLNAFHAERIENKHFLLSGFGKEEEMVDVYRIYDLTLKGDGEDKIIFKSMIVACTERPSMAATLILPATAFSHMNYMIHNVGVSRPVVDIYHDKEEYAVSPIFSRINEDFVEKVYSFASDAPDTEHHC